jgi:phage gp37-like protein
MTIALDFDFYVRNIEDAIVKTIDEAIGLRPGEEDPARYVKTIATYGGQLDKSNVREAIAKLVPGFPLVLVSYGDGKTKPFAGGGGGYGDPPLHEHTCHFLVLCLDNDVRGRQVQARGSEVHPGAYRMVSDVMTALDGLQFKLRVAPAPAPLVLLNTLALTPTDVEVIDRTGSASGYAVSFDTQFKWLGPERRGPVVHVTELIFDAATLGERSHMPAQSSGVTPEA